VRSRPKDRKQVISALSPRLIGRHAFHAILREFLEAEYSVQWRIMKFEEFGVPQKRGRLILLASWLFRWLHAANHSPGQPIPPFPSPTHGGPRLPPYTTMSDAIQNINPSDSLHKPSPFPGGVRYTSITSFHEPFPGTILASSATGVFPDGTRAFTKREYARLQTFSDSHVFGSLFGDTQGTLQRQSLYLYCGMS
jgi:DNA (cytosine-5)-methyltransferase 1